MKSMKCQMYGSKKYVLYALCVYLARLQPIKSGELGSCPFFSLDKTILRALTRNLKYVMEDSNFMSIRIADLVRLIKVLSKLSIMTLHEEDGACRMVKWNVLSNV
jgi:hypothetical protein